MASLSTPNSYKNSFNVLDPPHRVNPITAVGQEVLLVLVAQLESEDSRNFLGLFREADSAETHSTYL